MGGISIQRSKCPNLGLAPRLSREYVARFAGRIVECSRNGYTKYRGGPMRQVSLREFRTRGSKALETVPSGETVLLAGQKGPAYFLIPVLGDVILEDRELRRAMAKASLRQNWRLAEASATNLSEEEIEREINQVRVVRQRRKAK
jgi:antitoxin (DNA-binding transcriptional repressor) of toxin-antitoxin stability system